MLSFLLLCGHKVSKKSTRDLPYFVDFFVKPLFWDRIDAQNFIRKFSKTKLRFDQKSLLVLIVVVIIFERQGCGPTER